MDVHGTPLIRGWRFPLCWTAVDAFSDQMYAKTDLKYVMLRSILVA
jgi:hypothetical protein